MRKKIIYVNCLFILNLFTSASNCTRNFELGVGTWWDYCHKYGRPFCLIQNNKTVLAYLCQIHTSSTKLIFATDNLYGLVIWLIWVYSVAFAAVQMQSQRYQYIKQLSVS